MLQEIIESKVRNETRIIISCIKDRIVDIIGKECRGFKCLTTGDYCEREARMKLAVELLSFVGTEIPSNATEASLPKTFEVMAEIRSNIEMRIVGSI